MLRQQQKTAIGEEFVIGVQGEQLLSEQVMTYEQLVAKSNKKKINLEILFSHKSCEQSELKCSINSFSYKIYT